MEKACLQAEDRSNYLVKYIGHVGLLMGQSVSKVYHIFFIRRKLKLENKSLNRFILNFNSNDFCRFKRRNFELPDYHRISKGHTVCAVPASCNSLILKVMINH